MMKNQPLTHVDEIKPYLDHRFVILFGSAVSGKLSPKFPMIEDFTHTFLRQVAARLYTGSIAEQVTAGYALALVDGYHKNLLDETKFESFIFSLQNSIGKEMVDDLLLRIYSGIYNANHAALAFLLRKRVCLAVLTTNFDNALELCLPNLKVYIHPNKPPRLPSLNNQPALIKLHGDALSRSCVATSPQLSKARAYASHAYIETLLRDQTVLIFGYSGTGDIDIAPHLGKNERVILWGNYALKGSDLKINNKIVFLCDLSLPEAGMEKSGRRNILLDLAAAYGWRAPAVDAVEEKQKWEEEIVHWAGQIPLEHLRKFIASFMSWRTSWPYVHMTYLNVKESSYTNKLDFARAAVQVAAYNSSEKLLNELLLMPPPTLESYIAAVGLLGFTYWRQTRYQDALSVLMALMRIHKLLIVEWKALPDVKISERISGTARNYLETVIEMLHNERKNNERQKIVRNADVESAIQLLGSLEYETNYYLNRIAMLEIHYWLGNTISIEEIRDFFDQCVAMQEWSAAAVAIQFLLSLSLTESGKALSELIPHLRKRRSIKLIFKIYAAFLYEKLNRHIPMQVLNLRLFRFVSTLLIELVFSIKRLIWEIDLLLNQTRVETGFIGFGRILHRK